MISFFLTTQCNLRCVPSAPLIEEKVKWLINNRDKDKEFAGKTLMVVEWKI
jgi:hypothetical protein